MPRWEGNGTVWGEPNAGALDYKWYSLRAPNVGALNYKRYSLSGALNTGNLDYKQHSLRLVQAQAPKHAFSSWRVQARMP